MPLGFAAGLDQFLCTINSTFQALPRSPAASLLVAAMFGQTVFVQSIIMTYEGFRQTNVVARRGWLAMLIGQVGSVGFTLPFFLGTAVSRRPDIVSRPPKTEQIWSVLLAAIIGYLVPTWWVAHEQWSYASLSIWQFFPIYIGLANAVLPVILRPMVGTSSPTYAICVIAALSIALSLRSHIELLSSGVDFRDVTLLFWPSQKPGLTRDAHLLFLFDFITSTLAVLSHILLSFHGETGERKFGYVLVFTALVSFVGPAGALASVWALRETVGVRLAQRSLVAKATKGAQKQQ